MTTNRPSNRQEILDFMMAFWQSEVGQSTSTTGMLVGMVYEFFSEPPNGRSDKERPLLKTINDLDAELVRLQNKFMGIGNAFSTIVLASRIDKIDKNEVLSAVADFVVELGDYDMKLLKIIGDSQKCAMSLRSQLLNGY